ncbi:hypothetical protein F8388_014837, partial [Cannabis sativa]
KEKMIFNKERVGLASLCTEGSSISCSRIEIRTVNESQHIKVDAVTHSYPSTTISCIEKSAQLMEDFLELAKENTKKDLETCGILGASLLKIFLFQLCRKESILRNHSDHTKTGMHFKLCKHLSCQASNEEEVFTIQNEHSLFPVGWIHTHPTQSCFMSSVDLHTHYSYQVMVPEAFAIVMAPTDSSRFLLLFTSLLSYGIFRLTEPGGMTVLKECQEEGFHPHEETSDGSSIYEHCNNVYKNSNLRFEIFDLR